MLKRRTLNDVFSAWSIMNSRFLLIAKELVEPKLQLLSAYNLESQ